MGPWPPHSLPKIRSRKNARRRLAGAASVTPCSHSATPLTASCPTGPPLKIIQHGAGSGRQRLGRHCSAASAWRKTQRRSFFRSSCSSNANVGAGQSGRNALLMLRPESASASRGCSVHLVNLPNHPLSHRMQITHPKESPMRSFMDFRCLRGQTAIPLMALRIITRHICGLWPPSRCGSLGPGAVDVLTAQNISAPTPLMRGEVCANFTRRWAIPMSATDTSAARAPAGLISRV